VEATPRGRLAALARGLTSNDDPWWNGRQVAIRPDVPGPDFDPETLVLVRSDKERPAVEARIDRSIDATKKKSADELWPQWLWEADDDLTARDDELSESGTS
jgi:hypothetical protein